MSKPTNFSIPESLEVIWEAINEWELDIQSLETKEEREDDIDNVKTSMAWIEDALGLERNKHGDYVEGETAQANARLIASAPELLEMCKLFEDCMANMDGMDGYDTSYELSKVRAVLAKVEGETA